MNWIEQDNKLQATFEFKDFREAFAFMTEVAIEAEKQSHHPDWSNVWNKVSFKLNTHDAGGVITAKDKKLSNTISAIYTKYAG